jgi:uncharacterized membrane protein YbhN (UPF0104 family)
MVVLQVLTQVLLNFQWLFVARTSGIKLNFWQMFFVNCSGNVTNAITPGAKIGGEVTRAWFIKREAHCTTEEATAVVAMQKLFSVGAMFLIIPFSVGGFSFVPLLVLILLVVVLKISTKKEPRNALLRKLRGFVVLIFEQLEKVRKNKRVLIPLFLLSLFIWLLYPFKMYIVAVQFVPEISIFHVYAISFAAYLVAMIPLLPGGLGGFEGTMAGLLFAAGVSLSTAAVITVFFRFISFWLVVILSVAYAAIFKIFTKTRERLIQ